MKFIFIVQGEGRGHLTQAIALFQILHKNGHQIAHVIVGKSKKRPLPQFFEDNIKAPVTQIESPNFVKDRQSKSVNIFKTLLVNFSKVKTFLRGVKEMDKLIKKESPDAVINFYDFLGGLYFLLGKRDVKHIALAHQFLLNHSAFEFPKGRIYDRFSLLAGNKLAGCKAQKLLCLSFQPMQNEPDKKLFIVPPLLREAVRQKEGSQSNHFLVYIVNHGYAEQVETFHSKYPEIPMHCFWDKKEAPEELKVHKNLTFHTLDEVKFIDFMASCRGYLTTAGFESVCEAMYLGKPVLMIPVRGHYEQSCNALDAQKAGAGISSRTFDLDLLLNYLPDHKAVKASFREWAAKTEQMFLLLLTGE
ncbi:MAG: hypothetical protein GDA51_05530 [Ekhidna sp.]|nr:hypothetical protein [Ekhidna sp.]MBC6408999.1 hypothetical protein [Ekhidna sp.]MBC6425923.1 hypothetical protein [Ekhidna sp.]